MNLSGSLRRLLPDGGQPLFMQTGYPVFMENLIFFSPFHTSNTIVILYILL